MLLARRVIVSGKLAVTEFGSGRVVISHNSHSIKRVIAGSGVALRARMAVMNQSHDWSAASDVAWYVRAGTMSENLYVATDANGVEHSPAGGIRWPISQAGNSVDIDMGHPVTLRQASSLLDYLDERVFLVNSSAEKRFSDDGTVVVNAAHVVSETPWNVELAVNFALDCAERPLDEFGDAALPDGRSLKAILKDARAIVDGSESDAIEPLHYLARLRALRRLKHERADIAGDSLSELIEDEKRDVDVFDDPDYEELAPITDAVLAAIEALRHHVLPHLYVSLEDVEDEHIEHANLDRKTVMPAPTAVVTPFGAGELGAPHLLKYEPAWTSAREAARHARIAVRDRSGEAGETAERRWQADRLDALLARPKPT